MRRCGSGTPGSWKGVTAQYPRLFAHWAWVPYSLVDRMTGAG